LIASERKKLYHWAWAVFFRSSPQFKTCGGFAVAPTISPKLRVLHAKLWAVFLEVCSTYMTSCFPWYTPPVVHFYVTHRANRRVRLKEFWVILHLFQLPTRSLFGFAHVCGSLHHLLFTTIVRTWTGSRSHDLVITRHHRLNTVGPSVFARLWHLVGWTRECGVRGLALYLVPER